MRNLTYTGVLDRLLFTAIVVGILLVGFSAFRYMDASKKLSVNTAAQIHEAGGEVELESKAQAQGLMAADIERRRLVTEQYNMMVIGGVGLALLALGWLGYDLMRGRRRKEDSTEAEPTNTVQSPG